MLSVGLISVHTMLCTAGVLQEDAAHPAPILRLSIPTVSASTTPTSLDGSGTFKKVRRNANEVREFLLSMTLLLVHCSSTWLLPPQAGPPSSALQKQQRQRLYSE